MSTLNDTDLFVIERSGTNYQVRSNEMSTLQDTDLFVVERSGTNYQVEAKDINLGPTGSMEEPVSVLTPLNGAGLNDGQPYQPLSTAITAVGADSSTVYTTDTIASVAPNLAWDQRIVWSNGVTTFAINGNGNTPTFVPTSPATNAFNGSVAGNSNAAQLGGGYIAGNDTQGIAECLFTLFDDATTVKVNLYGSGSGDGRGPLYLKDKTDTWTQITDFPDPGGNTEFTKTVNGFRGIRWGNGNGTDNTGVYANLQAVTVDGKMLVDNGITGDPGTGSLLTFPTDNNFDKFEVGDVVQGPIVNQLETWSNGVTYTPKLTNLANQYNGDPASFSDGYSSPGTYAFFEGHSIEVKESVRIISNWNGSGAPGYLLWDENGTAIVNHVITSIDETIPYTGTVTRITVGTYGEVTGISQIFIDGVELVNPTVDVGAVSITDIDADAVPPTITVDGGSWLGADGTGDAGDGRFEPSQEWSNTAVGFTSVAGSEPVVIGLNPLLINEDLITVGKSPYFGGLLKNEPEIRTQLVSSGTGPLLGPKSSNVP